MTEVQALLFIAGAIMMGLGALGERMLIVVDIERLMLSSEMALVDEVAQ